MPLFHRAVGVSRTEPVAGAKMRSGDPPFGPMSIFAVKVSIDSSVDAAIEVERGVVVAQIRTGQRGAEVLNAQGHVRGWRQMEESTEVGD